MARRCVLHIGHAKTATTYLQHCLHVNQDALQRNGWWVPGDFTAFGVYDYYRVSLEGGLICGNLEPAFNAMATGADALFEAICDYMFGGPPDCPSEHDVLLSTELLFYYPNATARVVRAAQRRGFDVTLLAYLPRQDRGVIPGYLQNVRAHGFVDGVIDFLLHDMKTPYYRYLDRLDALQAKAPQATIVLRLFDPSLLVGGDVFTDFLATIGCTLPASACATPRAVSNPGLTLEHYEALRAAWLLRLPDVAARIAAATSVLTPDERARTRAWYYRPPLVEFLTQHYLPENRALLDRFMPASTPAEREWWQQIDTPVATAGPDPDVLARLWQQSGGPR